MTQPTKLTDHATSSSLADLTGRAQMPAAVRRGGGMKKLDWVLELTNPAEFVGSLATGELYFLMKDIGLGDSHALLEFATDEQLQGMLDIDCWSSNEVRFDRWLSWLDRAALTSYDQVMRVIRNTEDELLMLLFTKRVTVHGSDLETDTVPDELQVLQSPDFMYWVTIPREDEDLESRLHGLMKLMWSSDQERMQVIFQAARFELPSAIEELMIRFRAGRLEDLGFVAPDDALAVYTWLDPQRTRQRVRDELGELATVPARSLGVSAQDLAVRNVKPAPLTAEALALLSELERGQFVEATAYLVHKVFMAWTSDLTHTDELEAVGAHVASLVNLGLAHLADESPHTAAEVLRSLWPEQLFRVGYSLTLQLSRKARLLRARAGVRHGLSLFGEPADEALAAVAAARPRYYEGIEATGAATERDFSEIADLTRVEILVSDLDTVLAFFETHLGFSPERLLSASLGGLSDEERRHIRLRTLFRTGMVQVLLTDVMTFEPLTRSDLSAALALLFTREGGDARLSDTLVRAMAGLAPHVPDAVRAWMDDAMDELRLALGRVAAYELEPRYATELLLVAPDA